MARNVLSMRKLILIVLSLLLPAIAFATDPASFKKGYQWAQQMLNTSIDNQTGGRPTAGYPSYQIPQLANMFHRFYCRSADLASFVSGFTQCLEDNGRVMPMDPPAPAAATTNQKEA